MTTDERWKTKDGGQKTTTPSVPRPLSCILLVLYLCILSLRVTYTESPTAQTASQAGGLNDTVYSLTLSGLLIFALAAWLIQGIVSGRRFYRLTGIEIGLVVFLAACVISTISASDKRLAITQVAVLLGPILAAILLVQILDSPLTIRFVLVVVAALAIVSAYQSTEQFLVSNQIAIEQYEKAPETLLAPLGIEPDSFQQFLFEHRLYSRGVRGFFTTGNSAAAFTLMAAIVAIALLIEQVRSGSDRKSRSRDVLCRAVATALVVGGLLLTQSKGGILSFLLAASVFAILLHMRKWPAARRRLAWTISLPLAFVLAIVIGYAIVSYGLEHDRLPGGNSMLVRWQYWAASAQMFHDHPLTGVGPGNFAQNYTHYKPASAPESVADPHSLPLSLLTQYGPLGLLGFAAMVLGPIVRSARPLMPDAGPPKRLGAFSARRPALIALGVVCVSLLVLRPILVPRPPGGGTVVAVYEIVSLYVAPVAAFLIGFLLLATSLLGASSRSDGTGDTVVSAALGSAVFGVLVHSLIDFAIFEPGVWTTFWLVIACLVAVRSGHQASHPVGTSASTGIKAMAVAAALVLCGGYWHYVWKPAYEETTHIQRAQQAASRGWFDQAHRLLDAAFQADPLSPTALSLRGRLYQQQYEQSSPRLPVLLEEAAQCFRRAVEISSADYKDWERLGLAYAGLGQYQQACDGYTEAIERYPGCERLWFQRAQAAERLGRREAALADYLRAVEIEDAYQRQFRQMYPERQVVVSRLGQDNYELAKKRVAELSS
jgi:O-antigen ligase